MNRVIYRPDGYIYVYDTSGKLVGITIKTEQSIFIPT